MGKILSKSMKHLELFENYRSELPEKCVYRIDSQKIYDFNQDLRTYWGNQDWTISGDYFRGATSNRRGLFASDTLKVCSPYSSGNPRSTRFIYLEGPGYTSTIWFEKGDRKNIHKHRSWLTSFDAKNFVKLPSGEMFSQNPGKPVQQKLIKNPFPFIQSTGWRIKFTDSLDEKLQTIRRFLENNPEYKLGYEGLDTRN